MRIFYGFLVVLTVAILFMLPITEGVYDFRTDVKTDTFRRITGVGETTANMTLLKPIYDNDTATISLLSDIADDAPVFSAYNTATRELQVAGLAVSGNRVLSVSYDIDALSASGAIDALVDKIAWVWLIVVIGFAPAALVAIFLGRA